MITITSDPKQNILYKSEISDLDIAEYLEDVASKFDLLKDIKVSNTGVEKDADTELMDKMKKEQLQIANKLRNNLDLDYSEKEFITKTLNNIILISNSVNDNGNLEGIKIYLKKLN
ncbi:MAG TPA: hypothetical protein VLI92_00540 [Candidatus Saccharimonadales bacterium]|nr:hypothetical protein [Candidatus Saccharimonadales bacterium]